MLRFIHTFLILTVLCLVCGCGGGSVDRSKSSSVGTLLFNMDLSTLAAKTIAKNAADLPPQVTITGATVEITRSGHPPVTAELTVTNNIATGKVDNLDQGYWHVMVHVFSGQTEIYTGETDANVLAGVDSQVKVFFDPTPVVQTTGSLSFTVGLNPMPGYKSVNQQVNKSLYSATTGKIYLLDTSANIIGVYDAATMVREKDIPIPNPPMSMSLNFAKDAIFLGYPSGQIYKLDPVTNVMTLVADVLTEVYCTSPVSENVLLVVGKGTYDSVFKTLNLTTGQVMATKTYWYSFNDIVVNPANGVAYAMSINVSPQDIHRIQVDPATGSITEIKDSPYHGDFILGQPLRIIKSGTRVATAGGTTFSSSSLSSEDLQYNGNLNYGYADMAVDDPLGYLYLLNATGIWGLPEPTVRKLLVINQSNFFLEKTFELLGNPKIIFQTSDNIIVLTTKDSAYYVKVLAKSELGLK
jgi:hypothetical protein